MLIQLYQGKVRDSFSSGKVYPGALDGLPRGKASPPHLPGNVSPQETLPWPEKCAPPPFRG